jgi:simple sugar transport system permease protein
MTNGRGFISLAAKIFGNWTPVGAWVPRRLWRCASFQINLQFFRDLIPQQWAFSPAIVTSSG